MPREGRPHLFLVRDDTPPAAPPAAPPQEQEKPQRKPQPGRERQRDRERVPGPGRKTGTATATKPVPRTGTKPGPKPASKPRRTRRPAKFSLVQGRFPALGRSGRIALVVALLTGLLTHGWHLFKYPLYLTDEGIYMQRAWALLRETRLSPYTYDYDHAPGGWVALALWAFPLPGQFEAFGNAVNTGRFLMLLVHLASTFFLFESTRRLSGSLTAASVAAFLYNVSPLAVYYQRQVLLDNLMMFWVLLALYMLLRPELRVRHAMIGGVALGMALITKENAIFFIPSLVYLLHRRVEKASVRRFAKAFWPFTLGAPVGGYFMYATLKGELFPSGLDFDLDSPPADHVSLLYTLWWQINRTHGSLLTQDGLLWTSWVPRDRLLLLFGVLTMAYALWRGLRHRKQELGLLVVGTMALAYTFYLVRGSVVLDFYVAPLVPLFSMTTGVVAARLLERARRMLKPVPAKAWGVVPALAASLVLLSPSADYLLSRNTEGRVTVADQYHPKLDLTSLQEQQVRWIRQNISPGAKIIIDDDLWSELHDVHPYYSFAHSHWIASADPAVRDKLFAKKWQNIDYIVMSNKMRTAMTNNNDDGREDWIFEGLKNGKKVWEIQRGDIHLEIYQVAGSPGGEGGE